MADTSSVTGIDPGSWQVVLLPLPKRFSRGAAQGFHEGHPVGRAETARARSCGCWWPDNQPELLVEGHTDVKTGRAVGDAIPGLWQEATTGAQGAVVWTRRGERLVGRDLHDGSLETTGATGAAGSVVIGIGSPAGTAGRRAHDVGLVWREGAKAALIAGAGDVGLYATDGSTVAGCVAGRATLWPSPEATPVDLAPEGMTASQVEALDGETQIGIAWKDMCARAGLWRGTSASFRDLTPRKFATARAYGGARGYQGGFVRRKDTTRNGSTGLDNLAVLWQGAADRWFDLNALLPAKKYNASIAWAIEIRGDELRVCGEASRYDVSYPGRPRESHLKPVAHPVLWTARLRPGEH